MRSFQPHRSAFHPRFSPVVPLGVAAALWFCGAASAEDSKDSRGSAPNAVAAAPQAAPPPGGAIPSVMEHYQAGRFAEALEAFLKSTPQTAGAHFSAGILALKAQQLGRAHAHLAMAEARSPGNAEISGLAGSVEAQVKTLFGAQRVNAWANHPVSWFGTPLSGSVSAALALLTLALGFILLRERDTEGESGSERPKRSLETAFFAGLLLLITVERGASFWVLRNATPAVLFESTVGRSGPGPQFLERARLEPGCRVLARPGSHRNGWLLVRTPQETLAWVEATKVGLLFAEP